MQTVPMRSKYIGGRISDEQKRVNRSNTLFENEGASIFYEIVSTLLFLRKQGERKMELIVDEDNIELEFFPKTGSFRKENFRFTIKKGAYVYMKNTVNAKIVNPDGSFLMMERTRYGDNMYLPFLWRRVNQGTLAKPCVFGAKTLHHFSCDDFDYDDDSK